MNKPNFFIVGAPKCGTTALSEYLRSHPNIFMSTPKEPHFFAKDISGYSCCSTMDEYLKIFDDVKKQQNVIGEASVLYLYSESAIKNIYEFNPNAKIIVMLRNPVDYIYSYHSQLLINADENIKDFKVAWRLQEERNKGNSIPKVCRTPKLLQYGNVGNLGNQVERLLSIFPKQQVHFILLDDLKENARETYKNVLNFLDLPDDNKVLFPVVHENKRYVSYTLCKLRNNTPVFFLNISKCFKQKLGLESLHFMKKIYEINLKKSIRQPLDEIFKKELLNFFLKDINKLELLIDRNLSFWKL